MVTALMDILLYLLIWLATEVIAGRTMDWDRAGMIYRVPRGRLVELTGGNGREVVPGHAPEGRGDEASCAEPEDGLD